MRSSSNGDKAFKLSIAVSIIFHTLIFGIIVKKPFSSSSKKKTIYYVDMVNFGGGGGGGIKKFQPKQVSKSMKKVVKPSVKKTSMKELKAERETVKKKSSLTYSKPVKKVKERRKTKIRKKRPKKKKIIRSPLEEVFKNYEKEAKKSSENITGVGFGLGEGSGGSPLLGTFPYAYYIELIKNRISSNWVTGAMGIRSKDKYLVVISFRILKNGRVVDLKVEKSSGINSLDTSALRAVKYSLPLPPLPTTYEGKDLTVFIQFVYGGKK